jgi:transposase
MRAAPWLAWFAALTPSQPDFAIWRSGWPRQYRLPPIQSRQVSARRIASKANRDAARARGIAPVIPHKANEKNKPVFFARTLYKARARIEQGVGRLKRFKRVALRCEKTERNFRSIVSFAASLCLIKFVHTT